MSCHVMSYHGRRRRPPAGDLERRAGQVVAGPEDPRAPVGIYIYIYIYVIPIYIYIYIYIHIIYLSLSLSIYIYIYREREI